MSNSDCIFHNKDGVPYEEMSCIYPQLKPLYTKFELHYDPVDSRDWMQEHPIIPIAAVSLYVILIFWGRDVFMKEKKAYDWRKGMAMWNLGLSVFSWAGLIHTLPHLMHNLTTKSWRDNLCNDPEASFGSGSTGLWAQLFVLSKFPELIDTLFIVVHKKPLIFLHWYHHVTVLLYCWHSYVSSAPTGLFFIVMNYGVHAVMYGYYFLMTIKAKPKWFNPMWITYGQISQMIVGTTIACASVYYLNTDKNEKDPCWLKKENTMAACLMYGSYLMLFVQFFVNRFLRGGEKKKAIAKQTKVPAPKKKLAKKEE
mmetsp:Transcript_28912/g.42863  ORF Transcript_28912/g.42863 Transcript_28912/m.42863 type:complete len:311 (+) Transcript_28912:72-1004(+)|eukprot:CAMPEP_0195521854 /NCGR_PEP_ID=MMETSP0794_2-20130614/19494_1 /TAXON_ID=515487 /ORGANISM="Stephanopyxis turris, Strain CCMP 815" /LENGTH=310 /DNA_ID=CAMNT_0040651487 /DNA_START=71 /DNA_END=1003 /DNA_ORIENTATION=+